MPTKEVIQRSQTSRRAYQNGEPYMLFSVLFSHFLKRWSHIGGSSRYFAAVFHFSRSVFDILDHDSTISLECHRGGCSSAAVPCS